MKKKGGGSIVIEGMRTKLTFFNCVLRKQKEKKTKENRKNKACDLTSYQDVLVFFALKNKPLLFAELFNMVNFQGVPIL